MVTKSDIFAAGKTYEQADKNTVIIISVCWWGIIKPMHAI